MSVLIPSTTLTTSSVPEKTLNVTDALLTVRMQRSRAPTSLQGGGSPLTVRATYIGSSSDTACQSQLIWQGQKPWGMRTTND